MSDKNIEIIKNIQQYGHPLQGDKITDKCNYMYDVPTTSLEFAPPSNCGGPIMSSKPSKNEISVDYIESILMDHGSYEHPIERLVGELIMSDDEVRSAAQAIYDYVTKNT